MRDFLFLILFVFLTSVCDEIGAMDKYTFRHYTNKQGLSHNTVYCSLQDQKGFMWFGTDDGLNRFDGYTFEVYRHNAWLPECEGLPGDRIISLSEDSAGRVWICTNGGTCYYDYQTEAFHRLQLIAGENNRDVFSAVIEDSQKNLWMIAHHRIVAYKPDNGQLQEYIVDDYFRPNYVSLTEEGSPFFSDDSSLYFYKNETNSFASLSILTDEEKRDQTHISAILEVPQVGILIGTNKAGLKLYHSSSKKLETIIPEIQVRMITRYTNNVYWIASESGVYIYNLIDKSIVNLTKSLTNEYTLADNAIYSITKDREGGMWVGAFFGGISFLPYQYTHFNSFIGGKTHPDMLGNAVREIAPDQYGHLWLGTEDNGINCYTPATGEMVNFSRNNPVHKLSATNIHGLLADADRLWVGTYNKGIDLVDIPSGRVVRHYSKASTSNAIPSDFIVCFTRSRSQGILVGTSGGMVVYREESDSFEPWKNRNIFIRHIYEDRKGDIWMATESGVHRYILAEDRVVQYTPSGTSRSQGLGSYNTTSVFEDSKGRIWVTTTSGFSLYDEKNDSFNRITTDDGLPSNIIYRIVEDRNGDFWISTANGLVRFNPETYRMRTFTNTDGLHETQFNYSSSYQSPEGTIYMGTVNGMISFDPQRFREDVSVPPVYITHIQIPEDEMNTFAIRTLTAKQEDELKLPYHSSTFTLSYIALSYTSPDAIRYAYRLEGVDKDWIMMGSHRDVTFANLSPGKYVFKVRSTNSSGQWQENERVLSITITPPYWATGWAFLFYGLVLITAVFLFYTYKKKQLEARHQRNQALFESEKERELYNAKIQFFTFITHEIRTPLTLIKAPLEKILQSKDGSPATQKNLKVIESNTQRLLNLSNQLLDFRKTESRGFLLNYVKTDILLWVQTVLEPFMPVFEKEGKKVSVAWPDQSFNGYIDREAFAKIFSNLLTNALKYSKETIDIQLIAPKEGEPSFSVVVTNDGLLIPENDRENIFSPFFRVKETENLPGSGIGLSLSRSLAEFHKGSLSYHSTEDTCNQFVLTLPVEQEEHCFNPLAEEAGEVEEKTVVRKKTTRPVVLIVEDQSDMRQFICEELSVAYEVLDADNGKTALQLLEQHTVNLIISDVMMPVMDGFDLCNRVKNDLNYSHIPFILLTAQHNLQSRLEGLNKGADAYLEKPFSIELLNAQIDNLLKSREILSRAYLEKPLTPTASLAISAIDDIFLTKLNTYLEANLTNESLSVESIASEMHLSTSSLYRKVKALSGLSPVDFIRIARLKKAVQLLQTGEKRINEVAYEVGFSSPAYFSTCFQKQYGKSPSEFMREGK